MNSYVRLIQNGYLYSGPRYAFSLREGRLRTINPTFFIIGAAKSGTTSLNHYLKRHPQIYMSSVKEPALLLDPDDKGATFWSEEEHREAFTSNNYFRGNRSDFRLWLRCLREYQGEAVIGEASTYYTFAPHLGTEVPAKLARRKTPVKLIYVVRDPWERILSHYHFDRRLGVVPDNFELALKHKRLYLSVSLYWEQLAPYVEAVGKEQIHIVATEQLKREPESVLRGLFKFLKVNEAAYDYSGLGVKMNTRASTAPSLEIPAWFFSDHGNRIRDNVRALEEFTGRQFGWSE